MQRTFSLIAQKASKPPIEEQLGCDKKLNEMREKKKLLPFLELETWKINYSA